MPEDPEQGIPYAEKLRRKGIQVRAGGWKVTRDQVKEWRSEDGSRFKAVTDQAGHVTTQETTPDGHEKQHVRINLRS